MSAYDDGALAMSTIEHAAKLAHGLMEKEVAGAIMAAAGAGISELEAQALRLEGISITALFRAQIWAFHAKLAETARMNGINLPADTSTSAPTNLANIAVPIQPDGGGR